MIRALRAARHLVLEQKRWITSLGDRAKRCRQAFLNGNIPWASEEETALADENERKEAAKLGNQGWATASEASDVASTSMEPSWKSHLGAVVSIWLRRFFVGCLVYCWHGSNLVHLPC